MFITEKRNASLQHRLKPSRKNSYVSDFNTEHLTHSVYKVFASHEKYSLYPNVKEIRISVKNF